jgi:hypothetical protein
MSKQGRNDKCACGSGLKAKHCCLRKTAHQEQVKRVTQRVYLQQRFGVPVDAASLSFVMMNTQERIFCAAIRRKDTGQIVTGLYHGQCFAKCKEMGLPREIDSDQGFLTTHNRFVDRYEGLAIAQAAKQIIKKHLPEDQLLSEDYRVVEPEQAVHEARENARISAPYVEDAILSPELRASVRGA